ncbi:MAG: hypothetical protein AAF226_03000 [Verrucomicrobiota bacterium]
MSVSRFSAEGSPLKGKVIPRSWSDLDFNGRRAALVSSGYARDLSDAASLLSRHGAAIRRSKSERPKQTKADRWWDR